MAPDLVALLTSNGVPAEVVEQLRADDCLTVKLFSKWAATRSDIKELIVDKVSGLAKPALAVASVGQAVEEAGAIVAEQTKRSAAGLDSETVDDPLQLAVQLQLELAWSKKYAFELEPKYQPSNSC